MPREIDPAQTFEALVSWVQEELIEKKKAPGVVVGLSGTDSILAFLVCAEAFKRAGRPERVVGIHYGEPQKTDDKFSKYELDADEDQQTCRLDYDPWFQKNVVPWLKEQAPQAKVIVDGSINFSSDSHRWAALMDYSTLQNADTGAMRRPGDNFWVVGTRNATEEALKSYSNISALASVQPLRNLWKSEILKICEHLHVPQEALTRSRVADCKCGRFTQQAVNIEEADALLMIRGGQLSPSYAIDNIPKVTRLTLESFIATQLANSGFKKEIPYIPSPSIAKAVEVEDTTYLAAKKAAQTGNDTKPISAAVPQIIKGGHANAASSLVCSTGKDVTPWLPEALALFNTPGLRSSHKRSMNEKIFAGSSELDIPAMARLSRCNARIGNYGFSFPRFRYLTQHAGENASLVEQFGMQRLTRDTDLRSALLPDPDKDLLGAGFAWQDDKWYVELRRSYIVCANMSEQNPTTIVMRNNSYYYGRDRLSAPVYVSYESVTPADIQAITPEMLDNSGRFTKWQDVFKHKDSLEAADKLKRVESALGYLDGFEQNMNQWLKATGPTEQKPVAGPDHSTSESKGGYQALVKFLEHKSVQSATGKQSVFLGNVDEHKAPWFPKSSIMVTPQLVEQMKADANVGKLLAGIDTSGAALTLMTGEEGDFPVVSGSKLHR
jgi:NH3-dependent NAD+ synthetase